MAEEWGFEDIIRRMESACNTLRRDLGGLRAGRASPQLLEPVQVSIYGGLSPIAQLGSISVPEPRLLSIQVWDKATVSAIDTAIRKANLGLNPQIDGQLIRIPIPEMTLERRRELGKIAGKYTEAARVAIRNLRREGMDILKKQEKTGGISEDEQHEEATKLQQATDKHIQIINKLLEEKEKEISGDKA